MSTPSPLRTRSLSNNVSQLRKLPPVRLSFALPRFSSITQEQQRIRHLADMNISQFNSGRLALLHAKKAEWTRESWRLVRGTKRKWLYQARTPEVYGTVGKVKTKDVLGTSLVDFTARPRLSDPN